jgi:hypothetical protein
MCTSGQCTCAANQIYCGGGAGCVDTSSDATHCGSCGKSCGAGQACVSGQCICPVAGQVACGFAGCVDLSASPDNCGQCGKSCAAGQACVSGQCQCPMGNQVCQGACVNTATDPQACGSCNKQCLDGDTCSGAQCACAGATCNSNNGQICADTQHDPQACGQCGNFCNSREFCNAGTCACRPGFVLCNGQCTEIADSFNNCGACGNNCGTKGFQNPKCVAGVCEDTTCQAIGETPCGPQFAQVCLSATQLANDPRNCGQCGNTCGANEVCAQGSCQSYFTAPGCNACPCAACGAADTCCTFPGGGFPVCVQGNTCPQ